MNKRVLYLMTTTDRAESHSIMEMARSGIQATVVCEPEAPFRGLLEDSGLEVIPLPMRSKVDLGAVRRLRALLREREFDVVHAYYKKVLCLYTLASIGMQHIPLVAYRGIIGNLSYWDPFSWMSFLNPRLDRLICVCEAIRQDFLHKRFLLLFRLFDPERVITIHKGHQLSWYQSDERHIPADLEIPNHAVVIGCVARLKKRKGIVELIRAFEQIPESSGAYLLLVGHVEYAAIRHAAEASPARDRIRLAGFRSDAATMAGAFDITTLPSLRREGLPRAIIEAMSQRVPAVVSDSGGNPELVEDGVSGYVTSAGDVAALRDALRALVDDAGRRQQFGEAAQQRIRDHFTVENTASKTLAVYQSLTD